MQQRPAGVLKWEAIVNDPIGALCAVVTYEILRQAEEKSAKAKADSLKKATDSLAARRPRPEVLLTAMVLSQGGEFCFVLLAFSVQNGVLPQADYVPMAHPLMGAEDFSYVLQQVPGAMAFLGMAPAESADPAALPGLHSTRMLLDEAAMPRGAALLAGFALHFLDRGWNQPSSLRA